MPHDAEGKSFTVYSGSREDTGIHSLTVSSTIQVPDDYRLTTNTEHSAQVTFELTVVDSCSLTEFLDFNIPDIVVKVHDERYEEAVPEVLDTASQVVVQD